MGGPGSGYPDWKAKKGQTEGSLVLSVRPMSSSELKMECRQNKRLAWSQDCRWETPSLHPLRRKVRIQHLAVLDGRWLTVELKITLAATRLASGGSRWWFRCPTCRGRVGKLYLPVGTVEFACRNCHNLTYRSVQEHDQRVALLRKNPKELTEALNTLDSPNPDPGKFRLACKAAGIWEEAMQVARQTIAEHLESGPGPIATELAEGLAKINSSFSSRSFSV